MSRKDAFLVYLLHDSLKSLLHIGQGDDGKRFWRHEDDLMENLGKSLRSSGVLDSFNTSFRVLSHHHHQCRGLRWRETTWYERGPEVEEKAYRQDVVALHVRLKPAASNAPFLALVGSLFVESYQRMLEETYPGVFNGLDTLVYRYPLVTGTDPIGEMIRRVAVRLEDRSFEVEAPAGIAGSALPEVFQNCSEAHLPLWLALSLINKPTMLAFPMPVTERGRSDPTQAEGIRRDFYRRLEGALYAAPVEGGQAWARIRRMGRYLRRAVEVRRLPLDEAVASQGESEDEGAQCCSLCGSSRTSGLLCNPQEELGLPSQNERACLFCVLSSYLVPPALEPLRGGYIVVGQPRVEEERVLEGALPFLEVPLSPILELGSLESQLALNSLGMLVAASMVPGALVFPCGLVLLPQGAELDKMNQPIRLLNAPLDLTIRLPWHRF